MEIVENTCKNVELRERKSEGILTRNEEVVRKFFRNLSHTVARAARTFHKLYFQIDLSRVSNEHQRPNAIIRILFVLKITSACKRGMQSSDL